MLSASDIAHYLTAADPGEDEPFVLEQVRNFVKRRLLPAVGTLDRRGTYGFDPLAVYQARVFQLLTNELGAQIPALEAAAKACDVPPDFIQAPQSLIEPGVGVVTGPALRCAIEGTSRSEPEPWALILQRFFNPAAGVRTWHAKITPDFDANEAIENAELFRMSGESYVRAFAVLPLAAAFKNLPSLEELEVRK